MINNFSKFESEASHGPIARHNEKNPAAGRDINRTVVFAPLVICRSFHDKLGTTVLTIR